MGARQRRRTWHSRIPPPSARACLPSAMRCTHRPAPLACPCALPMTRCGGTGGGSRSNVSAGGARRVAPRRRPPREPTTNRPRCKMQATGWALVIVMLCLNLFSPTRGCCPHVDARDKEAVVGVKLASACVSLHSGECECPKPTLAQSHALAPRSMFLQATLPVSRGPCL